MLFETPLLLLSLFAAVLVQAAPAEIRPLKQASRTEIIERASRPMRKRDSPSGVTPPSYLIGQSGYNGQSEGYVGEKDGYSIPNPLHDRTLTATTLSTAAQACANDAVGDGFAGSFNVYYVGSTDTYGCRTYSSEIGSNLDAVATDVEPTFTESYFYQN